MTGEDLTNQTADTTAVQPADAVDTGAVVDEDAALAATFDRLVTNNGADRGEGGKFVSPKPATEGAQQDGDAPSQDGEGAEGADKPSPVAGTAAPAHLLGPIKAKWESFTPEEREAIVAHQAEQDRKFGDLGKQLQTVKPIADRLTEATTKFPQFKGMTPERLAQGALELAAVQAALETPGQAVGTIIEIAKTYKVLPQLVQALGGQGGDGQGDQPQLIAGLQQKISNLEAELRQASNPEKIRETVSMTFKERETETLVQNFAANEGKEFWAEVEADMPLYIQHVMEKGLATDPKGILSTAYDMAINANPEVRAKVRAAEAKATVPANDPKRTEAAKKAASINVPSTQTGKERVLSEDELLAAAYDRRMAS